MEINLNMLSDSQSSRLTLRLLRKETLTTLLSMKSTHSLTGLKKNSKSYSDIRDHSVLLETMFLSTLKPQLKLTGENQEWSPQLRTKVCADHAGLSQLLELLNQELLLP
jgi:hypothetical protein